MLSAMKKSTSDVILREVPIPEPGWDEVQIRVISCGVCGGDLGSSKEYEHFGHEIAGEVVQTGDGVRHLQPGMRVVVESSAFCGQCDLCRNGRVDLCTNMISGNYSGFSEYAVVKARNCVILPEDISYRNAALIEPLGVAIDLVKTADISLGDHVLVIGCGSIGLMAMALARRMGATRVWGATRSHSVRKNELALELGAEGLICTDQQRISDYPFPGGRVDKILITTPPQVIPEALGLLSYGGIAAFLGFGGDREITIDAHMFHVRKLQLRSSFAAPGIFFPLAFEMVRTGVIDPEKFITHTAPLKDIAALMHSAGCERDKVIKCALLAEE